jgi:GntR family transcriptional regulator
VREIRYRAIAEDLRERLASGELTGGQVLPSEADLSTDYGASRVTVRKALEALRADGLVDSRQGFGWFVAAHPLRQALGRLGTIEAQLAAAGVVPERRVLDFGVIAAPRRAREVLGSARVLRARRLNLADGRPFARVTVWCPEDLATGLTRAAVEASTFLELLAVAIGGATQTIGAAAASAADAALLEVPEGSPVLVCERVTTATGGRPVLLAEHVFPAHRTEFVVDLPHADPSFAPTGMRLVGRRASR